MGNEIIITILALFFSAMFSGYEIAFFSSNKLKIELDRKQGKKYALVMNRFIRHPDELISCLLMGNNVAIVIYGISMAKILNPVIEAHITTAIGGILAIETIVATIIVLVTAEFLPKALSRLNPNGVFAYLYWIILFFYFLLFPLTYVTKHISRWIIHGGLGISRGKEEKGTLFDKSDLMHLSNEVSGMQEQENEHLHDMEIFQNALNFSSVKLRECMVPRTEIAAFDVEDDPKELTRLFVESGYSRIMIYRDNIDNIIGYVHSKDLFREGEKKITELLRDVRHFSQEMSAQTLLAYFTKNRKSVAVVRDEYGGTGGIVTLEDLIEEIFGDIDDELDKEDFIEKKISDHEYIFSARLDIKELNRKFDLNLPESDDYETLAGLITYYHENIPKEKEVLQFGSFSFTIVKTTKNRIETVALKILQE